MASFQDAQVAKPHADKVLFERFPEVSGVGIERVDGGWGFKVNLRSAASCELPNQVDGIPVRAEVVGEVVAS